MQSVLLTSPIDHRCGQKPFLGFLGRHGHGCQQYRLLSSPESYDSAPFAACTGLLSSPVQALRHTVASLLRLLICSLASGDLADVTRTNSAVDESASAAEGQRSQDGSVPAATGHRAQRRQQEADQHSFHSITNVLRVVVGAAQALGGKVLYAVAEAIWGLARCAPIDQVCTYVIRVMYALSNQMIAHMPAVLSYHLPACSSKPF